MPTDLWTFAQRIYIHPGVEQACMCLQASEANICLLLTGLWLEKRQVVCTPARIADLQAIAAPWQAQVINPLRQLRMDWRAAAQQDGALAEMREQIKSLELQAERTLLQRLEELSKEWPEEPEETVGNWLSNLTEITLRDNRDALAYLRIAAAIT